MRAFLVTIVIVTSVLVSPAVAAGRRVALVIGAGGYQSVPPLPNPPRDAKAIAEALKRLGFETTLELDPDRTTLESAIRTLGDQAQDADAALFFYAGHAVEANGRNALVPVSAKIASGRDMPFETVDVDRVLDAVDGRARTVLIFLDACRDNPFQRTLSGASRGISVGRGLAAPSEDVSGTLIAFATAPGHTSADGAGQHSPFTAALLAHIETPGLEVHQLLAEVRHDVRLATNGDQIPWESSALEDEFYFRPAGTGDAGPSVHLEPQGAGSVHRSTSLAASQATPADETRKKRCHVQHVGGRMLHGDGAAWTMTVAGSGRACSFPLWRHAKKHEPFDTLAVSLKPLHGEAIVVAQHRIVYRPALGYTGPDTFSVASTPKGLIVMSVTVIPPLPSSP